MRTTPISQVGYKLARFLYIDDTDIAVMNNGIETAKEVVKRAQKLLDSWQLALNFMGGELKSEKYY